MATIRQTRFLMILAIILWTVGPHDALADEPRFLTGKKLRQDLEQLYAVNFATTDLRQFVAQASSDRHISIVIDRRLDTSFAFPLNLKSASLQAGLSDVARLANSQMVVLDSLVYLGPRSATSRLRTLTELRKLELSHKEFVVPEQRRSELLRPQSFTWQDLDSPKEILKAVTGANRLTVSNIELLPHDLWPAATLPESSLIDALSIVLIQFDLTFQWKESGRSIELVPIPGQIAIEKRIRPKQKLIDAVALVRQCFPDLEVQAVNSVIVVKGTWEQCEEVAELLQETPKKAGPKGPPNGLRERTLSLSSPIPIPLIVVFDKFEESDIHIEYDAQEMKDAGIDLQQVVKVDIKDKLAEDFFRTLLDPVNIDFQIQQSTVRLTPKKRRP